MRKRLLIALMTGSLALGAVSTYAVNGMIGTKEGEIAKENNWGFDTAEEKEAQKKTIGNERDCKERYCHY